MPMKASGFRKAMGDFATGVTVVTLPPRTDPMGITLEGFASVSFDPPLVLICLNRDTAAHDRLTDDDCDAYCVNLLTTEQQNLAKHFAGIDRLSKDPFETRSTIVGPTGAPAFEGSLAYLDCRIRSRIPAGEHTIWLGRVVAGGRPERGADPLTFFRGDWSTVSSLSSVPPRPNSRAESDAD